MEEDFLSNDEYEEGIPVSRWRRFLQITFGFIFIIAMLYFSGIYQYFLFTQTPEAAEPSGHEQIVGGDVIEMPTSFYVIGGINRDERSIKSLAEKASAILAQAGVVIDVQEVHVVDMAEANVLNAISDGEFLRNLPNYNPKTVTVILSRSLFGLNGIAFGRGGVIAIAEYTSGYNFRTLAHEMAHILGLGHTQDISRLMNSGGRGEELTVEEARAMRDRAQQLTEDVLQ
jgi:hypothetical protein